MPAVQREYDLDGRPIRLRHDALTGSTTSTLPDLIEYSYDPATGALRTVRDPQGNTFTYTHDNAGRLLSLASPAGAVNTYTYDADSRVETYEGIAVTRDQRGKILNYAGGPNNFPAAANMTYSPLGNLTRMSRGTGAPLETYVRDPLGNIVSSNVEASVDDPRDKQSRAYYAGSRAVVHSTEQFVDMAADPRWLPDGSYEYDAQGNRAWSFEYTYVMRPICAFPGYTRMADSKLQQMTYDANKRLRFIVLKFFEDHDDRPACPSWSDSTWVSGVAHRYDALGRRIRTQSTELALTTQSDTRKCCLIVDTQVWDGNQVLEDQRSNSSALTNTGGRVIYTHGVGIDRPLSIARRDGGSDYTVFPKVSWRGMLDAGNCPGGTGCAYILWPEQDQFAGYARAVSDPGGVWAGSLTSAGTDIVGLHYMRNRYYDPKTGSFTQADPIGIAGGLNVYGFANGDPVNYSDPFGLCPKRADEGSFCLDLFIRSNLKPLPLAGDGRDFDPDATASQSRAQIVVNPSSGRAISTVSPTCFAGKLGCKAPLPMGAGNSVRMTAGKDGSLAVSFNLTNSILGGPDIDGSVTFTPDGQGGWRTSGNVTAFPSNALYQRQNGKWVTVKPNHNETWPSDLRDNAGRNRW